MLPGLFWDKKQGGYTAAPCRKIARIAEHIEQRKTPPAENAEWYDKLFFTAKGTLTHLKSETKYVFKAAAISSEANKIGTYNFSDPVEKLIP